MKSAGLFRALGATRRRAAVTSADLRIVIKPDLTAFAADSAAATDPRLVELLIDLLHDAGYTRVAVVSSADSSAVWAENRGVLALADLSGYRFITARERPYDVLDLSEDLEGANFPAGALLASSQLSRSWLDAHFRIVFAKNRTDQAEGYSLCLESLLGVLPLVDKDYFYRLRSAPGEVVAELLARTPVQFALIDAVVSAHGSGGAQAPRALATQCIIAATDVQIADHVGALKMGLDPDVSRISSIVRRRIGRPRKFIVQGDLGVYAGWRNAHPLLVESTRQRDSSTTGRRLTSPWLQQVDTTLFPLKSPVDAKVNTGVTRYFRNLDDDPTAFATLVSANYGIGATHRLVDTYRVMFDKDALARVEVPLGLELNDFTPQDFRDIEDELAILEPMLQRLPEQAENLTWRYVEQAVVFRYTREIPMDFDEFAARVDVSRTIQFLNDYIGGVVVPVERDDVGRPVRQAERNIYLPQPNYIALADGKPIDVSKLEVIRYTADRHRMWWKTILSENASAIHDDGIVTFERRGATTSVTIVGRQLFVLPPFWQAMNLDLHPELKSTLVTQAYKTFFDRSFANLEAVAEGRNVRIGRPWHEPANTEDHAALPVRAIEDTAQRIGERARKYFEKVSPTTATTAPVNGRVDEDGFVHMRATAAQLGGGFNLNPATGQIGTIPGFARLADFWSGLGSAIHRDFGGTSV